MKTITAILFACMTQVAMADSTIYKCKVDGKTMYSESPCGIHTTKQLSIDTSERMGNTTYDREIIEAARARIREDANTKGVGASTGGASKRRSNNRDACESLDAEIKQLDAWARRPNYGETQDYIKQQKVDAQRKKIKLGC